jgi:TFIIF-interacting CTD phosphatase-like protein
MTFPEESEIIPLMFNLPEPWDPKNQKKLLILDMDETLIHCVDDIDKENPDYVIPIYFPDEEEPVHAGINVRPYLYECL